MTAVNEWRPVDAGIANALRQEAHLASSLCDTGLTALRNADAATPGRYYQGFFAISISLERFAKLLIAVDLLVDEGRFPTRKEMKALAHRLTDALARLEEIAEKRKVNCVLPSNRAESEEVIGFLTDFAVEKRYYNLDFLGGALGTDPYRDPVATWYGLVLRHSGKTPATAKARAYYEAIRTIDDSGPVMLQGFRTEEGDPLDSLADAYAHDSENKRIHVEGTIYCVRLFRFLYELALELDLAANAARWPLPTLHEFLAKFCASDSYWRGRKTFL